MLDGRLVAESNWLKKVFTSFHVQGQNKLDPYTRWLAKRLKAICCVLLFMFALIDLCCLNSLLLALLARYEFDK